MHYKKDLFGRRIKGEVLNTIRETGEAGESKGDTEQDPRDSWGRRIKVLSTIKVTGWAGELSEG